MGIPVDLPLSLLADASAASSAMRSYVMPVVATLCGLASLACAFFLVYGGIQYMSSSGNPEKLAQAKKILKNALLGLVLVIAAVTVTAILNHAYTGSSAPIGEGLPPIQDVQITEKTTSFSDVLLKAITGMFQKIAESVGKPFLEALRFFTDSTPLMGNNPSVFNLWRTVVGITDVLFVLVIALLGFHIMSFSAFGFDEIDIKQLLPQFVLVFLLINTSIFAIDGIISLSNAMIHAIRLGFPDSSIWEPLIEIVVRGTSLSIGGLLILIALLVVSVILLVYYVVRLVTLYLGAVLSPLVLLLWLIPAFKDFAVTALKVYLTTIFVLFVHVIILLLAASIFEGIKDGNGQPNTIMGLIVGLATLVAVLKAQGAMQNLSYAASTPRAAREMAGSFMKGASYTYKTGKGSYVAGKFAGKTGVRVASFINTKVRGGQPHKDDKDGGNKNNSGNSGGKRPSTPVPANGKTVKAEKMEKQK